MEKLGLPAGKIGLYEEMMDRFNSGRIAFGVPGTEAVAGTTTAAQGVARATKG